MPPLAVLFGKSPGTVRRIRETNREKRGADRRGESGVAFAHGVPKPAAQLRRERGRVDFLSRRRRYGRLGWSLRPRSRDQCRRHDDKRMIGERTHEGKGAPPRGLGMDHAGIVWRSLQTKAKARGLSTNAALQLAAMEWVSKEP